MAVEDTSFSKEEEPGVAYKNIRMKEKDDNGALKTVCTKHYGNIEFSNATRRSLSKFVRCADDTAPETLYELMVNHWKMEQPQLVINVGGGPESFALDPVVKQNLVMALSKVGEATGCWVITTGINTGVMRYIGEALQGLPSTVGIMSWNALSNIKEFTDQKLPNPGQQESEGSEPTYVYEAESWLAKKGRFLDSNHSHFLLVDDGTENQCEGDMEWDRTADVKIRDGLLEYLGKRTTPEKTVASGIILMMHGRPASIDAIHGYAKHGIPVVIVEKSGGTVDCLAYALNVSDEIEKLQAEELLQAGEGKKVFHQGLYHLLEEDRKKRLNEMDWAKNTVEECYSKIVRCLDVKKNIYVFSDSNPDVFMEAFMHRLSDYRQAKLTLSWNRADLAREKIFSGMVEWHGDRSWSNRGEELFDLTILALAMNNSEMVKLMLENGVSLSKVDSRVLEFLYGYRSYDKLSPLRYLFTKNEHAPLQNEYMSADMKMRYSQCPKYYVELSSIDKKALCIETDDWGLQRRHITKLLHSLCKDIRPFDEEIIIEDEGTIWKNMGLHQYPYRELFIWAVLNNMKEMALVFWPLKDDHLMKALIAAHICDKLQEKMVDLEVPLKGLVETATEFRQSSLRLLDEYHTADPVLTKDLLTLSFDQFKGLRIKDLVLTDASLENLDFISHDAVQNVIIERRWTGDLKDTNVSLLRLLVSWLILPLIFTLTFKKKSEIAEIEAGHSKQGKSKDDSKNSGKGDKRPLQEITDENVGKIFSDEMSAWDKICSFYRDTPVVRFVTHAMAYFVFLVFLSHSVMTKQTQPKLIWLDWLILVTVLGYAVSEFYQMLMVDAPSIKFKMKGWANSLLNISDIIVISLYFIALGLRLHQKTMDIGHLIYAIDVGLWWLRILPLLLISPRLGPYLVMITLMLKDLMVFLFMLLIFIVCYGVVSTAILEPHESGIIDINRLRNIFWKPYFNIYGELFTESEAETNKTRFGTPYHNVYDESLMWILLAVYLLFGNVLLLNLLIAIFGDRYGEVKGKSNAIWKYKRISLYIEYSKRSPFFPPFSLIYHFCVLLIWIVKRLKKIRCTCERESTAERVWKKPQSLIKLESDCMALINKEELQSKNLLKDNDDMKSFMKRMDEKVGAIETKMSRIGKETETKGKTKQRINGNENGDGVAQVLPVI